MLPSRGFVTSSSALRLQKKITRTALRTTFPSNRAAPSRQFGTAIRSHGRIQPGSRLGLPRVGGRIAAPVAFAGAVGSQSLFSGRQQARYASTEPAAAAAAATATTSPVGSAPSLDPSTISATPLDLDGATLLNMEEGIGYLKALGLEFGWGPTACMEWILENIHVYTGLPWWASIGLTAVLVRVAIFKPSLTAAEHSAKLQDLRKNPAYEKAMETMKSAAGQRDSQTQMLEARAQMKRLQTAMGFQMWRTMVPLINVPIGIGMFRLLRSMAALPVPSLETGGILWFTDLTIPDPFFILPLVSAGIMYAIMRRNLPYLAPDQAQLMKMVSYVITPLSIVVTIKMAAGLQFFFVISALLQWLQSSLFYNPWVRRWANLPPAQIHMTAAAAAATGARASPFSNMVNTTATDVNAAAKPASNPLSGVKESFNDVRNRFKKYGEKEGKKAEGTKARDYEEKRSQEENRRFYGRVQEKRLRQLEKKGKL